MIRARIYVPFLLASVLAAQSHSAPLDKHPSVLVVSAGGQLEAVALFDKGKFKGWRKPLLVDGAGAHRIRVTLSADEEGGMTAKVQNLGPGFIKFRMELVSREGATPKYTSSCPVSSGTANYEQWPYSFFQLRLSNPALLSESADKACT